MTREEFIKEIAKYVQFYAPKYGILVCSPIIAQACKESAFGTSNKAKYNNFFGLKYRPNRVTCSSGTFVDGSKEEVNGQLVPITDQWYKFDCMENGVEGYFQFINTSNYANVKGVTDPRTYLYNLCTLDHYCTSTTYVDSCMKDYIEKYNLTQYDNIKKEVIPMLLAIDSGHGSETAGKRTPDGYREHYANTKVADYFAKAMDRCGVKYIKTGWNDNIATDDKDTALSTRQTTIKNAKCDYSISFHFNASGDGKTYNSGEGIETLYHDKYVGDSKKMAECIQKYLIQGTQQKNRGVKQQSLSMCNCYKLGTKASVLIECAFMTNKRESELMKSDAFCKECAEETAKGFCEYIGIKYVPENTVVQPTKPEVPQPTLKRGAKGDEVKNLQKDLNYFGASIKVDGSFGGAAETALKNWQKKNRLQVDGSYGPASFRKMSSLLS